MINLVTGATGFIGSFIVEELLRRKERVRAFVRDTSNIRQLERLNVEIIRGDLCDRDSVLKAVKRADRIFHSAAIVGEWVSEKETYRVNVEGTRNILEAASNKRINRLIYISSLAVLGMKDHYKTPSNALLSDIANDPYIDSKIITERLVVDYCSKKKLPFTIIRPGYVFGPRDDKVIPRIVDFLKKGKYVFIGDGNNKINMIYVENLARAVVEVCYIDKTIGQIYNITNDSDMTMKELIYTICEIWGFKKPTRKIPRGFAYILCSILEYLAKITRSKKPPLLNKTRLKFLSLNLDFDISEIKKDINYTPFVGMKDGLKRTKEWMEKNL